MPRSSIGLVELLRATALFGSLPDSLLREFATHVERVTLPGGHTLIREGDAGDDLYLLVHGRLRAVVGRPGRGEQVVGEIARGESVGEMALLTGAPRSATVRAVRDSQLLRLSKAAFERVLQSSPLAAVELARLLVSRLQHVMHPGRQTRPPATIAVVPAAKDVSVAAFARALTKSLAAVGRAFRIDGQRVDEALGVGAAQAGTDGEDGGRVVGWLNELESRHDFVVYEVEPSLSGWTRRCFRQADRVLVVALADADGEVGDIEAEFWAMDGTALGDAELVLLHAVSERARATGRWLTPPRRFAMHHHVRPHVPADLRRLARLLAGQGVGLVLGGGGARAFAHIGVVRAFHEAGVPIDIVGGASMGAVMAAQIAAGWPPDRMLDATREAFVKSPSLFDYTVPVMSLIAGRRFVRLIERMFGDVRVEDLWTKYFCVSTNLTQAKTVVHETGPLAKWLCATISIPGLAPPIFHAGDLLVDGSLLDTIPARVARGYGRGPVVAVDVAVPVDLAVDPAYRRNPTTWEILWNRLNPFERRRLPTIYSILTRASMLSSEVERIRRDVDVLIHPPVEHFDLLDWTALDRIAELGYQAASERLTDWSRSGLQPALPP